MGPIRWFLFVYVLGGLTFLPLVVLLLFLFAYYTLPELTQPAAAPSVTDPASLVRDGDVTNEKLIFKTGTDDLAEKFHRKHDSDVATGYFAVCREYVPGGVNGKPPDKLSPAGEVVAQESPSVYQSMYRSIFDRSQKPTIEPHKDGAGRNIKKANNIFFVVLRHGHLMLYDDIQQLDVRYVISLEYHDVDIYGGEDEVIPEAELWIKRNSIRLRRKATQVGDKTTSLPFYFFSENLSEKEDFYHAILANKEKRSEGTPLPQEFETQHIINLVQKLHSSEEQLQTRWLNALLGRLFLAMYKTPFLEQVIRKKLTKKISRVKKPNFITKLALGKIDTGTGAPFITNPRLRDLTVNGECVVEADVDYTGCCRIEIAATARLDLGARFKAREVDIVLAATCKRLTGHMLIKFKPAPSNRLWFTFEKMPAIQMTLEPIVSSRQITYTLILKAIESRILEVFAEAIVLPFWDDMPFLDTADEMYRGGVWKKEPVATTSTEITDESPLDDADPTVDTTTEAVIKPMKREDRNLSMPVLSQNSHSAAVKAARKSATFMKESSTATSPERGSSKQSKPETPRILRSSSFASAAHPAVSPTHADGNTPAWDIKTAEKRDNMLKDISLKSLGSSPENLNITYDSAMSTALKGRTSSNASSSASQHENQSRTGSLADAAGGDAESILSADVGKFSKTNSEMSKRSHRSQASTDSTSSQSRARNLAEAAKSLTSGERKQALAASALSAAQAAQKWGWGVLARNRQREGDPNNQDSVPPSPTNLPMGRGRPLPPPGTPLPPPERPGIFSLAKKKAQAASGGIATTKRPSAGELSTVGSDGPNVSPKLQPSLRADVPDRRRRQASIAGNVYHGEGEEVLVVEAPTDSAPASPSSEHHDDFFGHGEQDEPQKQQNTTLEAQSSSIPVSTARNDLNSSSASSLADKPLDITKGQPTTGAGIGHSKAKAD